MIELISVSKQFDFRGRKIPVLKDMNLKIGKGKMFCVYGPSGVGKTTLLNIIGGMLAPTSGTLLVGGTDVTRLPLHFLSAFRRENIGFIFQQFNLLNKYTVLENVLFPLIPVGKALSPERARIMKLLDRLGIGHRADFPVRYLSGGEQQRVAVARALALEPHVIVADEPFTNLDPANRGILLDIFRELKERQRTIVLSSTAPGGPEQELIDQVMVHDAE